MRRSFVDVDEVEPGAADGVGDGPAGVAPDADALVRSIVHNLPGVVYRRVLHPDGRISYPYFSPKVGELLGISASEVSAKPDLLVEVIHPDDRAGWRAAVEASAAELAPLEFDFRALTRRGETRWFRTTGAPQRLADGSTVWDGMSLDITELKRRKAELAQAEARFRDVADAASDWIWEMDAELRFTYVSERFSEMSGVDTKDVVGRTRIELASDRIDSDGWRVHLDDLAARRPFRNFRYAFRHPDGRQFIAVISGRPIFDEQGAFRGYRGTGTDITGQVVAERQAIEQQNLLADAIEALSHGFALFDDQDRLVVCNRTYRAMHGADEAWPTPGIPYETLVRRTIERGTLPDAVGSEAEWIRHLLQFHRVADGTAREHRLVDGRWIATSKCRLANGWVATIRVDITELKQREAALKESEERFRALAEATSEGIIVHDGDKILDANRAFVDLLGYSYEDLLERDVLDLVSPEGRAAVAERIQAGSVEPYELMARRSDGTQFPAEVRAQTVAYQRRPVRVVALRDLSERKRAEEHIHHLAHHDALTGLPNRFLFLDRLRQAMAQARRDGQPIAVLQLDLDHFKDVNDTLGHHAGDDLLRQTARRLRDCVYDTDTVARLGGDEFAVILLGLERPIDAGRVAQRILQRLAEPASYRDHQIHTGTSIGITVFPDDDTDPDQLLKNADIALYRAKANGRNTFSFFVEAMKRHVEQRKELEGELRDALARHEFVLHYQPQLGLADGHVAGMEALLRWQHPSRGLLGPAEFLAVAEETGLIVPIGWAVLNQACMQAGAWRDQGLSFGRIAVNLAAAQFKSGRLARTVGDILQSTGVAPSLLELEVTEGVFLGRGADHVAKTLKRLHRMNVQISLDDFGTGYASLTHLKQFPIDRLKVDQTFVRDIGTDPEDAAIVRTVISLGHSLGLEVIAEGVETEEQRDFLRLHRCDIGQGFLFSKPLPAEEASRFLAQSAHPATATADFASARR